MNKLPEPPKYEDLVNEKSITEKISENSKYYAITFAMHFIFLKFVILLFVEKHLSAVSSLTLCLIDRIGLILNKLNYDLLYGSEGAKNIIFISKKAETKKFIYTSILILITYFLLSGLWAGATGGSLANGAVCAYSQACINMCDDNTTQGPTTDAFDDSMRCFSAGTCHGGSSYCNATTFRCESEVGADADCDDAKDNSCLVGSFCNSNCAFRTLSKPTSLMVRVNKSYLKNTRLAGLNLTWTDTANAENQYNITRSTDNSTFTRIFRKSSTGYASYNFSNTLLNDNTVYFYKVAPISNGSSPNCTGNFSMIRHNITADRTGPTPPNLILKNYTTKIELNWTHTENALSLYLPFEEPSGTVAEDWSNKTNRAVLVNTPTRVTGRFGSSLYFNGGTSSNYVNVSDSNSLDLRSKGTIMLWFRRNSTLNYQMYVTKGDGSNPGGYQMMDSSTSNKIVCRWGQDSDTLTSSQAVPNRVWTHVACIYNGTTLRLYINGYLDKTVAHTTNATANAIPLRIGARSDGYYYNGSIDEVWIYNRSLSQREVIDNMQSGLIKKRLYRATVAAGPYTSLGNFSSNNYTDSAATDTTDPGEVRSLTSSSHSTSRWSNDTTVDMTWTGAVDSGTRYFYNISSTDWYGNHNDSAIKNITVNSTLDGYDILCDTSSGELATTTKDYEETQTTHTCTFTSGSSNYYHVKSKDVAGNWDDTSADLGPFYIDTTHPSICNVTLINESTKYAYASGKTIYYSSASSGYFTVRVNATDAVSGISNVTYATTTSAGTIDTASAYRHTYDWDTSDVYSATSTLTCKDKATNSNSTTFVVTRDVTAPSGGLVSYTNGYVTSASIDIDDGTDSGAGLNSSNTRLLKRNSTLLSNNSCGTFGSWAQTGGLNPSDPYTDSSMTAVRCYEYRYEVYDNVWNNFNYTSSNILRYNNLPTHGTPAITPSSPNSTSNLTCTPATVADTDSHKVINITNWYRNNKSITVLNLPFEGNSAKEWKNVTDYSKKGNNGTVFGAQYNRTGGKVGGGYLFKGIDDYISIIDSSSLDVNNKTTIEAWFRTNDSSANITNLRAWTSLTAPNGAAASDANDGVDIVIVGNKIYYASYLHTDQTEVFLTAYSNLDGSSFTGWTSQTAPNGAGVDDSTSVAIGSDGERLYYAAYADDTGVESFYTAYSNLDGTGFSSWTTQTAPAGGGDADGSGIDMTVINNKLYFAAYLHADAVEAFAIANSNLDGTSFSGWTSQTAPNGAGAIETTSVAMDSDGKYIYYAAYAHNGAVDAFFTARSYLNGSGFTSWTTQSAPDGGGASDFNYPGMVLAGNRIYYGSYAHADLVETFAVAHSKFDGTDFIAWKNYTALDGAGTLESSSVAMATDGKKVYFAAFAHNGAVEVLGLSSMDIPSKPILFKNNSYELYSNSGGLIFDWNGVPRSIANVSLNRWHHAVVSHNGSQISYYLDGRIRGYDITGMNFSVTSNNLFIGGTQRYFNGSLDEVKIYNISIGAGQIYQNYNAGLNNKTNKILTNEQTGTTEGWKCSITPNDGYQDGTNKNSSTAMLSNLAPSITAPTFTPSIANTSTNIGCYATATDTESSPLTVYWYWLNSTKLKLSGSTSVPSGVNTLITTLGAGNTTKGESWNCTVKVSDGTVTTSNKTAKITIINSKPQIPVHYTPTRANITVHDRSPFFRWTSNDSDGDDINYTINITFPSTVQCGAKISALAINSNYTPSSDFCLDLPINWTVRAFDGSNYSSWSSKWNFTVESYISLNLSNTTINFGSLTVTQSKNTDNGSISPLRIENNGNIMVNIARIGANASLWLRQALNTEYFQFKADNDTTESRSFNWSGSVTSWTNMTSIAVVNQSVVKQLDYKDANDTAEIDLKVTVPLNEPPTNKRAQIYIVGGLS